MPPLLPLTGVNRPTQNIFIVWMRDDAHPKPIKIQTLLGLVISLLYVYSE